MRKDLSEISVGQRDVFESLNCYGVRKARVLSEVLADEVYNGPGGESAARKTGWVERSAALLESLVDHLGFVEETIDRLALEKAGQCDVERVRSHAV